MILPISSTLAIELLCGQHADGLLAAINANRDHLRQWLPWVDHMQGREQMLRHIEIAYIRHGDGLEFPGVITENGVPIGRIGLYNIDRFNQLATIGYWISAAHGGKGVVTQATATIIRHAFNALNLNRLEIQCAVGNDRSEAIPKRLGFTYEGTLRQCEALNGGFVDHLVYGLLKAEWEAIMP